MRYKNNKLKILKCLIFLQSQDSRIKIYRGDFFDFGIKFEELFDCVWDRGALVALPREQREMF